MIPNCVELFSGKGIVSQVFTEFGYAAFSIDKRKRVGICEPSLRKDILKVTPADIPFKDPLVVFAAVPCTAFSYLAGNYYYEDQRPNEKAEPFIKLLKKTLSLIEELRPAYFFIENPRGHLHYNKLMIDFLARNNGCVKYLTLGSYGFPTTKPTDLFTNAHDFKVRGTFRYGRGAKTLGNFDNLTTCQRQETPRELALDIARYIDGKIKGDRDKDQVKIRVESPEQFLRTV